MSNIEKGAFQALTNCLGLKKDEKVMIITDIETLEIGVAFLTEAKRLTKKIKFFIMEDFSDRPLSFLPAELKKAVHESDVGVLVAQGKEGELQSFRKPFLEECDKSKIRFANMINVDQTIMEQGVCSDYAKIQRFSKDLYGILKSAKKIEVKSKAGTSLVVEFDPEMKWVNADGIIGKEHWSNLPDGEIYTCPKDVNGIAVIDGVLGDYFAAKYSLVSKWPVYVEIKSGRAIRVKCQNKELEDDFREYINLDENASRVGEFALGTNLELKKLIGKLLQDEKYPGVHIAFGHGYPKRTGCKWSSVAHLDGIMLSPTVIVDGKKIMDSGEYTI